MTTPSGAPIGPRERKIALLGSRSVGKSSLAVQLVDEHFVDSYYPTIDATFEKDMKYKGKDYKLKIHDTAGQDEFSILHSDQASGLHGWALVYSVASRSSFEMIHIIRDKILAFNSADTVPMVLIGNKSDLADRDRQVKSEEGQALATQWKCKFIETSARKNENVTKAYELLIEEMEKALNPQRGGGDEKEASKGSCVIV